MDLKSRTAELTQLTEAMRNAWPFLLPVIKQMQADKTQSLIAAENPEARGAIKALQGLIDLPETVKAELEQIRQQLEDLPE